jgi:endonuclease/exonuclease/phosphatase family metal-dependent hydrolase
MVSKRLFRDAVLLGLLLGACGQARVHAQTPVAAGAASGAAAGELRVVAWNIKHGRGMDDQVDLERIAEVLRELDADVITLQEVDDRTERTGGVDQVAVLADLLGYDGVHGPHRPYQGGFYGNAVLTRLPVLAHRTRPIPPASGSALAVHEVVVAVPPADGDGSVRGLPVSVFSVHLAGTPAERMAQADAVTAMAGEAPWRPTILAGDFNGRPEDEVVVRLGESWNIAAKSGDPRTYPSPEPDREIDFVMWRSDVRLLAVDVSVVEHHVVDEPLASDHRPLLAVFRFRR